MEITQADHYVIIMSFRPYQKNTSRHYKLTTSLSDTESTSSPISRRYFIKFWNLFLYPETYLYHTKGKLWLSSIIRKFKNKHYHA